jgi:hypothetical protein
MNILSSGPGIFLILDLGFGIRYTVPQHWLQPAGLFSAGCSLLNDGDCFSCSVGVLREFFKTVNLLFISESALT